MKIHTSRAHYVTLSNECNYIIHAAFDGQGPNAMGVVSLSSLENYCTQLLTTSANNLRHVAKETINFGTKHSSINYEYMIK